MCLSARTGRIRQGDWQAVSREIILRHLFPACSIEIDQKLHIIDHQIRLCNWTVLLLDLQFHLRFDLARRIQMLLIQEGIRHLGNTALHFDLKFISVRRLLWDLLDCADLPHNLRQSPGHGIIFFSISLKDRFILSVFPGQGHLLAAFCRCLIDTGQFFCRTVKQDKLRILFQNAFQLQFTEKGRLPVLDLIQPVRRFQSTHIPCQRLWRNRKLIGTAYFLIVPYCRSRSRNHCAACFLNLDQTRPRINRCHRRIRTAVADRRTFRRPFGCHGKIRISVSHRLCFYWKCKILLLFHACHRHNDLILNLTGIGIIYLQSHPLAVCQKTCHDSVTLILILVNFHRYRVCCRVKGIDRISYIKV